MSGSVLSDGAILQCMEKGTIIIAPFKRKHLSTSSYDVCLGEYFFREAPPSPGFSIYNPYSRSMVEHVWGAPHKAELAQEYTARTGIRLENIAASDRIIFVGPGETILAHTQEFIGGRHNVTTMMKARSSLGRNFIEVCKCAGWGDVGYTNRWTMEITNNSHFSIPLVVGRRIAQIVFFETCGTPLGDKLGYACTGKYQTQGELKELQDNWSPLGCLPRLFDDYEVKLLQEHDKQSADAAADSSVASTASVASATMTSKSMATSDAEALHK